MNEYLSDKQSPAHHPADRLAYERKKKATQRKKRKHRLRLIILGELFVLILLVIGSTFCAKGCFGNNTVPFKGTFRLDDNTYYEFDGEGSGSMILSTTKYAYTYSAHEDKLKLDFVSEDISDCEYTFTLEGDALTLIGGKGTMGGIYTLIRQK